MYSKLFSQITQAALTSDERIEYEKIMLMGLLMGDGCIVLALQGLAEDIARAHLIHILSNNIDANTDPLMQELKNLDFGYKQIIMSMKKISHIMHSEQEQHNCIENNIIQTIEYVDTLRDKIVQTLPSNNRS